MPQRFRTQAEYYLRLAELADAPEDKAQFLNMACAWHRLTQELDMRQSTLRPRDAAKQRAA
jgi:hypothetical protein